MSLTKADEKKVWLVMERCIVIVNYCGSNPPKTTVDAEISKHRAEITPTTKFADLDADSLTIVEIIMACEEALTVSTDEKEMEDLQNIGEFHQYLLSKLPATPSDITSAAPEPAPEPATV